MRETSREAYESMIPHLSTVREKVYSAICADAPKTSEEVETMLEMKHQTVSSSIHHLVKEGFLEDSGERGLTVSGRKAIRWKPTSKELR